MKTPNVSLNVQSNVSFSQHNNSESTQPVKRSKPSIGRYLVRSGNTLLFQMRLPKSMVTTGPDIIRISLGALALREAREIADELASTVRAFGRAWECSMDDKQENTSFECIEGDREYDLHELRALHMKTLLKTVAYKIKHSEYVPSPFEEKGQELIRNLLPVAKEVAAKENNEPHISFMADHAQTIASGFSQKFLKETAHLRQEGSRSTGLIDTDEASVGDLAETFHTEPASSQPDFNITPAPPAPAINATQSQSRGPRKAQKKSLSLNKTDGLYSALHPINRFSVIWPPSIWPCVKANPIQRIKISKLHGFALTCSLT